jgi:hypothetical protein
MEFNKDKAGEIAEKFNIPPATIRTWKNRNKIPDYYFTDNFLPTGKKLYKFWEILILNKEKINFFFLQRELNISRLSDAQNGKSKLNVNEVKKIKYYFISLLEKKPEKILFCKALHLTKIYSSNTLCNFRQKFKRGTLSETEKKTIFEKLSFLKA